METRSHALQAISGKEFDLAVIGGGIAGAGVAQDAASRGLSVVLLEKDDFASGTSSRTTKLIHGGLRYLEQFHFKLTRELCQERGLLEHLAPHLVRDFSFIMPLVKGSPFFSLKAEIGLSLYDLLSWSVAGARHHRRLSARQVLESCPALDGRVFSGGLRFHDCITDDSRMVLEVVKSACAHGAVALNYVQVTGFETEAGAVRSLICHDRYSGQALTVRCRACVNATGVWSDELFGLIDQSWRAHVQPSKGVHIIVPASAFETNTALFLPTRDGRYVFVVPWQRALMIGTTDNAYSGHLDKPLPSADEIDYLLAVINGFTQTHKLNRSDIIGSFAGLRPLVQPPESSKDTKSMSREHVIFQGPGKVVGLNGGKLTNYRIMANHVLNEVATCHSELHIAPSRTKNIMLGGFTTKSDYLSLTASISAKARKLGIEPATLDHLIASYGADASMIVDIVEADLTLKERICPDFPPILAEIPFCVRHEMAVSLEDLLMRRLRLGILNQKQCLAAAPKVAELMQILLRWDNVRLSHELSAFERAIWDHMELVQSAPVA